jgi:hypothetical protein
MAAGTDPVMTTSKRLGLCAVAVAVGGIVWMLRPSGYTAAADEPVTLVNVPDQNTPVPEPPGRALDPVKSPTAVSVAAPVIDEVLVEKDEVCEGEENLVRVRAHTTDGNDDFLHYTIAGESGGQVPLRAYLGRDGNPIPQFIMAFSKDNVATRIEVPSYRVKSCRPDRVLIVTVRMLPNSLSERELTATVQSLDGSVFTPVGWEWSFGDGTSKATATPVVSHDYSQLPQRTAFTDVLVAVKATDGGGRAVRGRLPLHIRNVAFYARQQGTVTILAEPTPRFPTMGSDGVVHQKFRLWHMEDAPVQITGATMAKMFVPAVSGGMPPSPNPVALDFAEILQHRNIDPGATIEETLEYDFGSDPDVYAVVYEVHGVTPEGVQARGQLTVMRPPPEADARQ